MSQKNNISPASAPDIPVLLKEGPESTSEPQFHVRAARVSRGGSKLREFLLHLGKYDFSVESGLLDNVKGKTTNI